jgi:hypothetical protein
MAGAINEICFFGGGETDQAILDTKQMLRAKWGLASVSAGVTGFTGLSGLSGRLGT